MNPCFPLTPDSMPSTTLTVLPQPRDWSVMCVRPGSGAGVQQRAGLHWAGEYDSRIEDRLNELFPGGLPVPLTVNIETAGPDLPCFNADESYRLEFSERSVLLHASATWGALHGVTTLWQLHMAGELPIRGYVQDEPRFAWRGLLVDVARHFIPEDVLRRVVDGLARLKMNVLHLHLSDDQGFRFRSRAYPGLASDESYSTEQLAGLVAYAARLGVRVVPELDVPGHVHCWLERYPQWGSKKVSSTVKFGVHRACLNVTDENVIAALGVLFDELAEVFPDEFVHIGGDEVHPAWWSEDENIQAYIVAHALGDERGLQAQFNQRLFTRLTAAGKRVVGWDEVLHPEMPPLVVQNWRGATTRDRALAAGRDCIVSAGFYLDLHYPADIYYGFDPEASEESLLAYENSLRMDPRLRHIAGGLAWTDQWRAAREQHEWSVKEPGTVLGGEACLWSELVDGDTLEVRLWSRLPAVAERLWSAAEVVNTDHFYERLECLLTWPGFTVAQLQRSQLNTLGLIATQIEAAAYLEPVKWYARLLGEEALRARLQGSEMPQARPYDMHSALHRVVDYISPESLPARGLAACPVEELKERCTAWSMLQADQWPRDTQGAIGGMVQVGRVMLELLNGPADKLRIENIRITLEQLYGPYGEYMLAVVPPLLVRLDAWRAGER